MAYRSALFRGHPHFWCHTCKFDTPHEGEILGHHCRNAATEQASPEAPARNATKAEWASYAATHGIDADGLTRKQIIEALEVQP